MSDTEESFNNSFGSFSGDDANTLRSKSCSDFYNKWKKNFRSEEPIDLFGNRKIILRVEKTIKIESPFGEEMRSKTFKFSVTNISKDKTFSMYSKPVTVNMFQFYTEKNKTVINVGGPIWALAWKCAKKTKSLLAVYTHLNQYQVTKLSETYCHGGVIQLWQLRHNFKSPTLKGLFYIDYAPIFDMQWIPIDIGSKILPPFLVGLLAFCGSDHVVRISPIQTPSKDDQYDVKSRSCTKMQIIFNLIPGRGDENKVKEFYGKALCFKFTPISPHNIVVVGYGNGYVCVYNLQNDSQINFLDPPLKYDVYPTMTKACFSASISSIDFCPFIPSLILVSGVEPKIVLMDLKSPSDKPLYYDAISSKIRWPVFSWEPIFSESFSYYCAGRGLRRLRLFSDPIEVTQVGHKCDVISNKDYSIMDMEISDKYGYQASSACNGSVYVYNYNQTMLKKLYKKYREKLVYKLDITDQDQGDLTDLRMLNERKGSSQPHQDSFGNLYSSQVWSESIESTNKRFEGMTLTYIEYNIKKLSAKAPAIPSRTTEGVIDDTVVFNPLSINKVALNCNSFGYGILASGGNAGLLRIEDISRFFK